MTVMPPWVTCAAMPYRQLAENNQYFDMRVSSQ